MDHVAVRVLNLSKRYKLYSHPWHRAAESVSLGQEQRHTDFWALKRGSTAIESVESVWGS